MNPGRLYERVSMALVVAIGVVLLLLALGAVLEARKAVQARQRPPMLEGNQQP